MSKIIFVIGKPGSGKTTYINSLCNKLKKEDIVVLNDWYIFYEKCYKSSLSFDAKKTTFVR